MKKIVTCRHLLLFVLFASCCHLERHLDKKSFLLAFAVTGIWYRMYRKVFAVAHTAWEIMNSALCTALLSLAVVASNQVHFELIWSRMDRNYIHLSGATLLLSVSLFVLLLPPVTYLFDQIKYHSPVQERGASFSYKSWLGFFAVIYLIWIPYILTFYPAGVVGDGRHALEEALAPGIHYDHWVVLHILSLKMFLFAGKLFDDPINAALFGYALVQSLISASVCALVSEKVRQFAGKKPARLVAGTFALSSFFVSYGTALWKDSLFGAFVVLLAIMFLDKENLLQPSRIFCGKLLFVALFICFWRNNGIFVLVFCLLALWFLRKKIPVHPKILLLTASAAIFTIAMQNYGYKKLGIARDVLNESISVPLQQVAAVINHDRELTPGQAEFLFRMLPREQWKASYWPASSDPLKLQLSYRGNYLSENFPAFGKVWCQLLFPNFKIYVEAYLMEMLGFWQLDCRRGFLADYWYGINRDDLGFPQRARAQDLFAKITGVSIRKFYHHNFFYVSSGTMVWLTILAWFAMLYQRCKRDYRMAAMLPFAGSIASILISSPLAYSYRYVIMLAIGYSLILLLPFCHPPCTCASAPEDFAADKKIRRIILSLLCLFFIGASGWVLSKDLVVYTCFSGEKEILLAGAGDASPDYSISGLSFNENRYRWTSGNEVSFQIPGFKRFSARRVALTVVGTFAGKQSYTVRQNGREISRGEINGAGEIEFPVEVRDGVISFTLHLPDAKVVHEVIPQSQDMRKVAVQLSKIRIFQE